MNRVTRVPELGFSAAVAPNPETSLVMPSVLVVIDMQPGYPASQDAVTQWFVKQEILRQSERNLPVLLVEFDAHEMGETFESIRCLVESYEHGHIIDKRSSNGSAEILSACRRLQLPSEAFRICGVNSDACVLETVQGLLSAHSTCLITLPQDACNCLTGKSNSIWQYFQSLARVTVELHVQMH